MAKLTVEKETVHESGFWSFKILVTLEEVIGGSMALVAKVSLMSWTKCSVESCWIGTLSKIRVLSYRLMVLS